MNKQQLINELTLQTGFTRTTVQKVFESLTGIITNELKQGGEIRLQGFAILSRWYQTERPARNPKTGTPHTIPARFSVKLKPGKLLLEELNNTQTKNK